MPTPVGCAPTKSPWTRSATATATTFGLIAVDPGNADRVVIGGVPLLESTDGGATWSSIAQDNVHVDHHHIWIDPNDPAHIINGNDGGINVTLDGGAHWTSCNSPAVGQFYAIAVDDADPFRIYGGLQDNGTWRGPSGYDASPRWHQTGDYPYDRLNGGDGMRIEVDTRDNETVYTGYQFGWYSRSNRKTGDRARLHPRAHLGRNPAALELANAHSPVPAPAGRPLHGLQPLSPIVGPAATTLRPCPDDLTRGVRQRQCALRLPHLHARKPPPLSAVWPSVPMTDWCTSVPTAVTLGKSAPLPRRKQRRTARYG